MSRRPNYLAGVLCAVWLVIVAVPLYVMLKASFETQAGFAANGPISLPSDLTLDNWVTVFTGGFLRYFWNTVVVTVVSVAIVLVLVAPLSFAVVRNQSRVVTWAFRLFLFGLAIPAQAVVIPIFYVVSRIGLYDNLLSVILVTAAFSLPISMLILTGSMRDISQEIYDALALDGASPVRMFFRVVLPLSKSGLSTVAIFSAMGAWNGFIFPLVLTQSRSNSVISLGLFDFESEHGANIPGLMAAVLFSMLPLLVAYLFARRALVQGLMGAGGK